MSRSGSERSGSTPRVAASKVFRVMPNACASGHSASSHWRNAVSAAAAGVLMADSTSQSRSEAAKSRRVDTGASAGSPLSPLGRGMGRGEQGLCSMLGIVTPSPAALRAATSARRGEVKIGPALIWISPAKFLVPDPVRDGGIDAKPPLLVLLVILEIALEPFDVALALERQHVGGDAVEEPAVVADDDRAAGEILERLLERAQGVDIEVVGRLVEEEHIGAGFEHLGEMHPVALAAGELADLLLLVRAAEIERRAIGARIDLALAEREQILAAGDLLPYAVLGLQRVARLVDVAELDRLADADCSGVGLLLAGDHAEQRGLSGAVGADHPDDAARRQFEAQILDQQIVAIALGEPVGVDDVGAEPLRDRNDDLGGLRALVGALGDELLVGAIARLGFRLPRAARPRSTRAPAPWCAGALPPRGPPARAASPSARARPNNCPGRECRGRDRARGSSR